MKHALRSALLLVAVAALSGRPALSLAPQNPYNDPGTGSGTAECDDSIGDGNCAGSGAGEDWGVQCDAEQCTAWTNCANGKTVTCVGFYRGQADKAGVGCKDSGGDLWNDSYC